MILRVQHCALLADAPVVNLGKWILRYLFAGLIDEEMKRDNKYREVLSAQQSSHLRRDNAPHSIQLPPMVPPPSTESGADDGFTITPRPANGVSHTLETPGLAIGVATPFPGTNNQTAPAIGHLPRTSEEGPALDKKTSQGNTSRTSTDKSGDYFSALSGPQSPVDNDRAPNTPGEAQLDSTTQSPVDTEKEEKSREGSSLFGKKFRMNFPKKLGRTSVDAKPPVVDEKSENSEKAEDKEEKLIQDNLFGTLQKIRHEYTERLHEDPDQPLRPGIMPSLASETPELKLPPSTAIIIQEDRPGTGGVADLYRGTVGSVGHDADLIEQAGPMWLGDLLLRVWDRY